jgi:hypothetical protein
VVPMIKAQIKSARLGFPDQTHHGCGHTRSLLKSATPSAKSSHNVWWLFTEPQDCRNDVSYSSLSVLSQFSF